MNTSVVILAATPRPASWDGDTPRHLLNIGGELLILRTIRQLKQLGYDNVTVMTDKPEVQEIVPKYMVPENSRWIVSTILSSRELWDDRTVILPGDTVWDIYVLGLTLACNRFPMFYGDAKEIHAVVFLREHFEQIEQALKETERIFYRDGGWCWLAHFYRVFTGRNIHDGEMKGEWTNWWTIRTMHTPSRSCTTDFDTMEDYQEWFRLPHV